jgi:purine-binding chemotaxis protein CheW
MIGAEENVRFLLCQIGSAIGALALEHVREVMRPLPIGPLDGMPPFVLGLAIVRGAPTPVIDAGRLLGVISTPSAARFVLLKLGERRAALAVDAVLDVRSMPPGTLADIPPLLRDTESDHLSAIGALDKELLIVLEAARLIPESVWHAMSASGAFA